MTRSKKERKADHIEDQIEDHIEEEVAVVAKRRERPFYQLAHALIDFAGMSAQAKLMLIYAISKPPNWIFLKSVYQDLHPDVTNHIMRRALRELHELGHSRVIVLKDHKILGTRNINEFWEKPFGWTLNPSSQKIGCQPPTYNNNNSYRLSAVREKTQTRVRVRDFGVTSDSPTARLVRTHAHFSIAHGYDMKGRGKQTLSKWEAALRRLLERYNFSEVQKIHTWWMTHYDEKNEYQYIPRSNMNTMHGFCERFDRVRDAYLKDGDNEEEPIEFEITK